jgi:hypothetical protein
LNYYNCFISDYTDDKDEYDYVIYANKYFVNQIDNEIILLESQKFQNKTFLESFYLHLVYILRSIKKKLMKDEKKLINLKK